MHVSADIEDMFLKVRLLKRDQLSLHFCGGRTHIRYECISIYKIYRQDLGLGSVKSPETASTKNRSLVQLLKLGVFNLK